MLLTEEQWCSLGPEKALTLLWRGYNNDRKQRVQESEDRISAVMEWGREAGESKMSSRRRLREISKGRLLKVPEQCDAFVLPFSAADLPEETDCPTRVQN